jgi:hypothetical protein
VRDTLMKGGGGSGSITLSIRPTEYLSHSFVESPDMKNVYDGVVALEGKEPRLPLPFSRNRSTCAKPHVAKSARLLFVSSSPWSFHEASLPWWNVPSTLKLPRLNLWQNADNVEECTQVNCARACAHPFQQDRTIKIDESYR